MEQGSLEKGPRGGWVGTFLASAGLFLVLYVATLLFGHKLVYWLAH